MTERNSPAREFSFHDQEEDPLEELARIVSGEKKPQPKSQTPLESRAAPSFERFRSEAASEETSDEMPSGDDIDADLASSLEADLGAALGAGLEADLDVGLDDSIELDLENELIQELEGENLARQHEEPAREEPLQEDLAEEESVEESAAAELDDVSRDAEVPEAGEGPQDTEDQADAESLENIEATSNIDEGAHLDADFDANLDVDADFDFETMVSEEDGNSSLEDQLMVELGLSGTARSSRPDAPDAFVSGFEDEVTASPQEAAPEDAEPNGEVERGSDLDFTDIGAEEVEAVSPNKGDQHGLDLAGDFKDKFEAELAIDRAALALNIDSRRHVSSDDDDDDLSDLGFDMSIWDAPKPAPEAPPQPAPEQQAAGQPAANQPVHDQSENGQPSHAGSLAPDAQELTDLNFDSAFEAEMAELQPQDIHANRQARPAHAYQRQPAHAHGESAGRSLARASEPAGQASMFNSEREIDDHFAAVFAEELGFDEAETVPAHYQHSQHQSVPGQPGHAAVAYRESAPDAEGLVASFSDDHAGQAPVMDDYDDYAQPDAGHHDDATQETWAEPGKRSGSRGFKLAAIALGLALVVGLGAVSYGFFKGSDTPDEPVIVKADKEPVKTKPDDPGGATVANQDKAAYERVSGKFGEEAKQEKLVSDVEKPVNLVTAAPMSSQSAETAAVDAAKGDDRLAPGEEQAAVSPTSLEPRRVRTLTVRRDGTIVQPSEPEAAPAQTASLPAQSIDGARSSGGIPVPEPRPTDLVTRSSTISAPAPKPQTAASQALRVAPVPPKPVPNEPTTSGLPGVNIGQTVVPVPSEPGTDPLTTQSVAKAHQPGEPVALTSEPDVSPAAQATDAELSEWVIQISSQRSPEDAQAAYNNLRNRFPNLLEDRHVAIVKADLPGKGIFYRVRVGSQSKEDATDFCQRLQSAGGACFVTR